MGNEVIYWRRLDGHGFERLCLSTSERATNEVRSTIIATVDGGFRLDHHWQLAADWRALSVAVECWTASGHRTLLLERDGERWQVDGVVRPDLDGAEEPDLSATPFCNTIPIRRLGPSPGDHLQLDACYIDAAAMTVVRSRQRYERLDRRHVRYVDLGVASGFTAVLAVDDRGLVSHYEHLFERVAPEG